MSNNVRLNEKLSPPPVKKSLRVREVSASNLLWPARPGWLPVKAGLMDVRVVACGFSVSHLSSLRFFRGFMMMMMMMMILTSQPIESLVVTKSPSAWRPKKASKRERS